MGCLLAVFAFISPRVVMVVLWVFTDYLSRAFDTFIWPLLGFVFLPTTTLAYAVAVNSLNGLRGIGLVLFVAAVLFDLGVIGGGGASRRRRVAW